MAYFPIISIAIKVDTYTTEYDIFCVNTCGGERTSCRLENKTERSAHLPMISNLFHKKSVAISR